MRPKIMSSRSITRTLTYNEQKVTQGQAELLTAANFLKEAPRLTYDDKLRCFERRMQLNERVKTSQHITLNFDPADKLTNQQMQAIAQRYMKEIGFEDQPYLVYRHHDAGHPHCHIVTTHIRSDGSPIELYNIGRNQSEEARQRIEEEFHLVTTEQKQKQRTLHPRQRDARPSRIEYGEAAMARQVSDVLDYVTETYKCTRLEEFNAILRQYNLEAYRGSEDTQLHQSRGLLYRVLDKEGRYVGVPLKASFFDSKPTLDNLEERFAQNQSLKQEHQQHVEVAVVWELYISDYSIDFESLNEKLRRQNIEIIPTIDKEGNWTQVHYIDFENKCVFSGEDLDPRCNHLSLQQAIDRHRLAEQQSQQQTESETQTHHHRLRQHF